MTRLALVAVTTVAILAQDLSGPVVRVIDGDTIEVELAGEVERHLLYVACTRARDHLLVTAVEPGSEFLDDLLLYS